MADENKGQAQHSGGSQKKDNGSDLEAQLKQAAEEMENDVHIDETAATVVYPADIGYSAHALHKGPSTSPHFVERNRYERERNADPDRENKLFARDVLGLDVEVDDHPEPPEEVWGGQRDDQ
jgi:hypothetical protein